MKKGFAITIRQTLRKISGGSDGKESACSAGDLVLIPRSGRSSGERHGNRLQYSCLDNPLDREAWRATDLDWNQDLSTLSPLKHSFGAQNLFLWPFITEFEKKMVGGMGEACKRPPDPDEHPYGPISFLSLTPFSSWEPRSYRLLQFIILSNFLLPSASRPPRTILKAPWSKRRLNLCFEGIHLRGSELVLLYSLQNFPIQKSFLLKTSTYGSCNQAHLKDFLPFFSQGLQHSYFL